MNNMINFGIDLGTTNSLIARFHKGTVEVFKNPNAPRHTAYRNRSGHDSAARSIHPAAIHLHLPLPASCPLPPASCLSLPASCPSPSASCWDSAARQTPRLRPATEAEARQAPARQAQEAPGDRRSQARS